MTDLLDAPAVVQAAALRAGEVSSVELVEGYLRRIDAVDGALASFRCVVGEQALADAAEADRRRHDGDALPFLGVPLSVKDLTDTRGVPTSKGLAALRDRVPDEDAAVVRRLRAAGFVLLGKTSTPALGLGCVTEPAGFPPTRNPWDPRRTPGGSSGGAAAALAAGLCAVSHGSDGGGSIRIPASWTGLVGLKPSRGRVSAAPEPSNLLATDGPLTRTVLDAASLLDVMTGAELGDAFWAPPPSGAFADALHEQPGRLRVAVSFAGREVDPARRAAVLDVARLLADLGHEVCEADPDPRWGYLIQDHLDELGSPGLTAVVESLPRTSDLDPLVSELVAASAPVSAERHARAHGSLLARARRATERFSSYDVVLSPTTAQAPPLIGQHRELPVAELFAMWESYVPFTTMWNWTGSPAISLPTGVGPDGLPLSVQLAAAPAQDGLLLRLAAQLEDALDLPSLRPPHYTWGSV